MERFNGESGCGRHETGISTGARLIRGGDSPMRICMREILGK